MREILFRGKRVDNGAWEAGSLVVVRGGCYDKRVYITDKMTGYNTPVAPETVGQYTGLTDKTGKNIFEGDIIEFYFFGKTRRNGELIEVKNTKTMVIEWQGTSFCMTELFRNYRLDEKLDVVTEKIFDYKGIRTNGVYKTNARYFVEVIGNIHDNPELLEV